MAENDGNEKSKSELKQKKKTQNNKLKGDKTLYIVEGNCRVER